MKKDQLAPCLLTSRRVPDFSDLFPDDLDLTLRPESLLSDTFSLEDLLYKSQKQPPSTNATNAAAAAPVLVFDTFEAGDLGLEFTFEDAEGIKVEEVDPTEASSLSSPSASSQLHINSSTGIAPSTASSPITIKTESLEFIEEEEVDEDDAEDDDDDDEDDDSSMLTSDEEGEGEGNLEELDSCCSSDYEDHGAKKSKRVSPTTGSKGKKSLTSKPRRRARKSAVEKKKPGRKPQPVDEETRKMKRKARQEKNRMAARKCREKKQSYFKDLEVEVIGLRKGRDDMAIELGKLRQEVALLRSRLAGGAPARTSTVTVISGRR